MNEPCDSSLNGLVSKTDAKVLTFFCVRKQFRFFMLKIYSSLTIVNGHFLAYMKKKNKMLAKNLLM